MLALVKSFRAQEVRRALEENPALLAFRDERGRNWLHVCCATKPAKGKLGDSVKTAETLLAAGLDLDREAFREGEWKATPLWFAIARGENLPLAELLLERGCDPNHCLWAAAFRSNLEAIRLLVRHGARLDDCVENETPFLAAVKTSRFDAAEELLRLGADPNFRDPRGMTALHYMLKKTSDAKHFAMLLAHGARPDIPDPKGVTALAALARKKAPAFRRVLASARRAWKT
jgi:ankyrin repeat protein